MDGGWYFRKEDGSGVRCMLILSFVRWEGLPLLSKASHILGIPTQKYKDRLIYAVPTSTPVVYRRILLKARTFKNTSNYSAFLDIHLPAPEILVIITYKKSL